MILNSWRFVFPTGEIAEFDASLGDMVPTGEGDWARLKLRILNTVRWGSIYDKEGAD